MKQRPLIESLIDFKGETLYAKKLASEKPGWWELYLAVELLESKLKPIKKSYHELKKILLVQPLKSVNGAEVYKIYNGSLAKFTVLNQQLIAAIKDLQICFNRPDAQKNALEIKKTVDRMVTLCKELLAWEREVYLINPPNGLKEIKAHMQGCSKFLINHICNFAPMLRMYTDAVKKGKGNQTDINLAIHAPNMAPISPQLFIKYIKTHGALY